MTTLREIGARAKAAGVKPAALAAVFREKYGRSIADVDPDEELGATAPSSPEPSPFAAGPIPKMGDLEATVLAMDIPDEDKEARLESMIKAHPDFGKKIETDSFESVGKAQSTPISTLGSAIGGGLKAGGEAFVGLPTALSLLPGAVELGVQKQAGKGLEVVRRRTSEKFDAYKARVDAGESVPEAERLALLSEVEANLGAQERLSLQQKETRERVITPDVRQKIEGIKELAPVKAHFDEEAEFAKRLSEKNMLQRTLQDLDEISSAIPHLVFGLSGYTDQESSQVGRELVGGAIGGTTAVLMNPVDAFAAKPLTALSTIAGPLAKLFKAARLNPKAAKFIEENPAIQKLARAARAVGNVDIPVFKTRVAKKTVEIGKKVVDEAEPTVRRTASDMESLKVKHVLGSAASGAGLGMLIGMPGFGALTYAGGKGLTAWARANPKGAARLAGVGRWLDDTSTQLSAGRTQQVRHASKSAPESAAALASLAERLKNRIEAGESGAERTTTVPTEVVIGDRDIGVGGALDPETVAARADVAPIEASVFHQEALTGRRLSKEEAAAADRLTGRVIKAARDKVVRAEEQGLATPELDAVSAEIFGDFREILGSSGVSDSFAATFMRTLEDAVAGGHSLLKSDIVREKMLKVILDSVDPAKQSELGPIIERELLHVSADPFKYENITRDVDGKTAVERTMVGMVPGEARIAGASQNLGSILATVLGDLPVDQRRKIQGEVIRGIVEEKTGVVADARRQATLDSAYRPGDSPGRSILRIIRNAVIDGDAPPQWLPTGFTGAEFAGIVRQMTHEPINLDSIRAYAAEARDAKGRTVDTAKQAEALADADYQSKASEIVESLGEDSPGGAKKLADLTEDHAAVKESMAKMVEEALADIDREIATLDAAEARFAAGELRGKSLAEVIIDSEMKSGEMTKKQRKDFRDHTAEIASEFGTFVRSGTAQVTTRGKKGQLSIEHMTFDELVDRRRTAVDEAVKADLDAAILRQRTRADNMGLDSPSSMDRHVSPGFAATMEWQHKFATALNGMQGGIGSMIKSGLTIHNPATHINNFTANVGLESIRQGTDPLTTIRTMYKDSMDYLEYKRDPNSVPAARREVFRIIDDLGIADSDLVGLEVNGAARSGMLGALEAKGGAGKLAKIPIALSDLAGKTYKWGDQGFKISAAVRVIEGLVKGMDELREGSDMRIRTGESSYVTLTKRRNKDGDIAIFRGKDELTPKQYNSVLGAAGRRDAMSVFFDYSKIPGAVIGLRGLGPLSIASPFITWAFKAIDFPGKRGLVSNTLFGEDLFTTTDHVVARRLAKESANKHLRRLMILQAANSQMHENQEFLQDITSFKGTSARQAFFAATSDPMVVNRKPIAGSIFFGPTMASLRGGAYAAASALDAVGMMNTPDDRKTMQLIERGQLSNMTDVMNIVGLGGSPILEVFRAIGNNGEDPYGNELPPTWYAYKVAPLVVGQVATKLLDTAVSIAAPESGWTTFSRKGGQSNEQTRVGWAQWATRKMLGLGWTKVALYGDKGAIPRYIDRVEKKLNVSIDRAYKDIEAAEIGNNPELAARLEDDRDALMDVVAEEIDKFREEVEDQADLLLGD